MNSKLQKYAIETYLRIHVSELKQYPEKLKAIWRIGQELYKQKQGSGNGR